MTNPKPEKKDDPEHIQHVDSSENLLSDTIYSEKSPIKIISAKIIQSEYSDHKDIRITYKNTSNKSIQAIKFEWNCKNAFERPANGKFFYTKGYYNGYSTALLKPKKTTSKIWEDFSTDANKIISSNAYLVVYTDATIWKLKKSK